MNGFPNNLSNRSFGCTRFLGRNTTSAYVSSTLLIVRVYTRLCLKGTIPHFCTGSHPFRMGIPPAPAPAGSSAFGVYPDLLGVPREVLRRPASGICELRFRSERGTPLSAVFELSTANHSLRARSSPSRPGIYSFAAFPQGAPKNRFGPYFSRGNIPHALHPSPEPQHPSRI